MVIEVRVFRKLWGFASVFGFVVNRRSHVFAVALIRLDADCMELIVRFFDSVLEIPTAFLAFGSVITERLHDLSDVIVVFLDESESFQMGR